MSGDPAVADRVVEAITAVDGVAGLYPGGPGAIATHLPGRSIAGLRLGDTDGEVHIVAELRPDAALLDIAERVRRVAAEVAGVPVRVVIADVTPPRAAVSGEPA